MAPRCGASMMMLVGHIGPKLFLPICMMLSKNDVIITDFFVRGHDEISGSHVLVAAGEASSCSISIFFAVLASSRPGITMIFFCDALSQVVSSDSSAAMNVIEGSRDWKDSVDFFFPKFAPSCRPVDQRSPLCDSDPSFPIDISLCFCCSQC